MFLKLLNLIKINFISFNHFLNIIIQSIILPVINFINHFYVIL